MPYKYASAPGEGGGCKKERTQTVIIRERRSPIKHSLHLLTEISRRKANMGWFPCPMKSNCSVSRQKSTVKNPQHPEEKAGISLWRHSEIKSLYGTHWKMQDREKGLGREVGVRGSVEGAGVLCCSMNHTVSVPSAASTVYWNTTRLRDRKSVV